MPKRKTKRPRPAGETGAVATADPITDEATPREAGEDGAAPTAAAVADLGTDEERESRLLDGMKCAGRDAAWRLLCSRLADRTMRALVNPPRRSDAWSVVQDRSGLAGGMRKFASLAELRAAYVVLNPMRPAVSPGSLLVLSPAAVAGREKKRGRPLQRRALAPIVEAFERVYANA